MTRSGTVQDQQRDSAAQAAPARALVLVSGTGSERDGEKPACSHNRPPAGFVTQLLIGAEPSLRPSRLSRTRDAAALYARAARLLA